MGEAKTGADFIKHEFDEAIAIQRSIVEAGTELAQSHPMPSARQAIKAAAAEDKKFLKDLETRGRDFDATGEIEDVAGGLTELMSSTLDTATSDGADSDYYEAHAVLLNLKRKQMDSAGGMRKIAAALRDKDMRQAATTFERSQRASAKALAAELATYAKQITAASPQ